MKKYLVISALLHAALFISISNTSTGQIGQGTTASGDAGGSVAKPTTFTGPIAVDIVDNPIKGPGDGGKGSDCTTQYGGIGVEFKPTGLITAVAPASPAEKAGIAVGDTLVFQVGVDYAGQPGTSVEVYFYKALDPINMLQVMVVRDVICYIN